MKVLSIGTDRKLFETESSVLSRNKEYAKKMEELHIVVFSLKKHGFKNIKDENVFIYPTNSVSRYHYVFDAFKISKKIFSNNFKGWVITSQDPFETGLSAYLVKRKTGISLQIQIHTDFLDPHFRKNFLNRIRVFIAKFVIKKADGLRVVSSVIKDSIIKNFKNKTPEPKILPVFVDIEKIINTKPTRDIDKDFPQFKFIVLMASRLTKEKRINIAIKAMKEVLKKYPQTGLVICGAGPEKEKLKAYSKHLKIDNNIVFAGWHEDLISYYKTANLFLLTSEYEGYGMTLVEAGASGCPIVTTRVGLAKTDLFQNGVNSEICNTFDYKCISESVVSLISDNQKRELFRHRMQDSIKTMLQSREDYVEKYVSLLNELVKKDD